MPPGSMTNLSMARTLGAALVGSLLAPASPQSRAEVWTDQPRAGELRLEPASLAPDRLGEILAQDRAGAQGDRDRGRGDHRHQRPAGVGGQEGEPAVDGQAREEGRDA